MTEGKWPRNTVFNAFNFLSLLFGVGNKGKKTQVYGMSLCLSLTSLALDSHLVGKMRAFTSQGPQTHT